MPASSQISENMRRLRTSKGQTQEEVARSAGITRQAYRDIETGATKSPRVGNLQGIARALGVGLAELVAEPRRLNTVRFRLSRPKKSGKNKRTWGESVQATREQLVIEVARWLEDFNGLERLLGDRTAYALKSVGKQLPAEAQDRAMQAARLARDALGLKEDQPIGDICAILEAAGVKVRAVKLDIEDFFGLSVAADDGGPAIVVNVRKDIPVERRIFTAAHELGHLLLHPRAYDVAIVAEDPREEEEADAFASHLLMPPGLFKMKWDDTEGLARVNRVLHVKRTFRVSYMTVLYRLAEVYERGVGEIIKRFRARFRLERRCSLDTKKEPDPLREVDFLVVRLSRLVRRAIESEQITLSRGAEILDIDLHAMRERASSWDVAA